MRKRVIDDRFELMERLGGGGMGLVWRAWDVALHREVALKEVRPPDPLMDEQDPAGARELRARVLREARALARLNHPHVATIHHIVDPGEQAYPWIVMELVSGGSLQDRIQRGPMPPQEVARLGREVLSALRAAHAVGIQHRDVKPANVLLREDGRSVLTDFGIAAVRESTSLTATGSFIGSPEYMAPERINGVEGDPASDLWSLGMMLYVAVEGRHPLRRSTTLATLAAVLNQEVPPPERAGALGPVLRALLNRDVAARPDAETLDRMLAAATTDQSFTPGPAPATPDQSFTPGPAPATPPGPSSHSGPSSYPGSSSHAGPSAHPGSPSAPSGPSSYPGSSSPYSGPSAPGGPGTVPPAHSGPYSGSPGQTGPSARPGAVGGGNTVPPGYGSQPPPWGGKPVPESGTLNTRRSRRRKGLAGAAVAIAAALSVTAVVVVGVLVWRFLPLMDPNAGEQIAVTFRPGEGGEQSREQTGEPTEKESTAPKNLLTPAGMRAMIAKIKPVIGGTKVVKMVVYPDYASFDAPLKKDPELYDSYSYRDGAVSRTSTGGEVDTPLVDLAKFNWNAVPGLLKKADKDLGVPKPTTRYLIVDPDYAFASTRQVLLVYVSDEYRRGGYLVAHPKGNVLKLYPND
ncbi:Serine/threonine protein kinase [Nonomuraea solani]|uniref:non-specific serine/threonine protein kinase n=1 Tax=Nonomuraea solani TaxID=1144553 RepID=A0A1H6E9B8_9ACTN|nr:serine/threonine-protein kinase [Nonomuraea solani]SEG93445.1 Serine/threonine protein kinase [Nonomuraea solani]